jgi:hypothetical protein
LVRMVPMPDPEERPDLQQVHARVFFFCGQCTTRREGERERERVREEREREKERKKRERERERKRERERERERKREREEKAHRTSPHRLHLFHNSKFARGSRA